MVDTAYKHGQKHGMVLGRIINTAKIICAVLIVVFFGQGLLSQVRDLHLVDCSTKHADTSTDQSSSEKGNRSHQHSHDHCCSAGTAFYQALDSFYVWLSIQDHAFPIRNDLLPDGPTESVEYPPQIS